MFNFNSFNFIDMSFHLNLCLSVALSDATKHLCCLFKFHEDISGCNIPVFWPPATVTAAQFLWLCMALWLCGLLPLAHWLCDHFPLALGSLPLLFLCFKVSLHFL